jgi:hypothetical protein
LESSFMTFVQQKPQELKNLRVTKLINYIYIFIYFLNFIFFKPSLCSPNTQRVWKLGNLLLLLPKAFQIFMTFVQLKLELKYPCTK